MEYLRLSRLASVCDGEVNPHRTRVVAAGLSGLRTGRGSPGAEHSVQKVLAQRIGKPLIEKSKSCEQLTCHELSILGMMVAHPVTIHIDGSLPSANWGSARTGLPARREHRALRPGALADAKSANRGDRVFSLASTVG